MFAAEPRDVSLLFTLFYIATAGSFDNLINTAGGAQENRIVGGSQRIALKLAKKLGKRVRLKQPVHLIKRHGKRVEVHGRNETWTAKRAIIALAPALIEGIEFKPKLPPMRAQLHQRVPMGSVIKCMAVYETPFWRAQGLSGMATSNTGPVKLTFDNTPASGSPGVLLGFMEGQDGRDYAAGLDEQRRDAVLGSFERYFGSEARTGAIDYVDKVWAADPWSRGCYVGYMPPGVAARLGRRAAPAGRPLHWAGTETATVLGRLHGRRDRVRPARRGRGARRALSAAAAIPDRFSAVAELSNHHRDTVAELFDHQGGGNVEWRKVHSLLEAIGTVTEEHNGKLKVEIGPETEVFTPPKHKDIDRQMLVDLRRMLSQAGYGPDSGGVDDERDRDYGDSRRGKPT